VKGNRQEASSKLTIKPRVRRQSLTSARPIGVWRARVCFSGGKNPQRAGITQSGR